MSSPTPLSHSGLQVFADLCVRFTSLTDPYTTQFSSNLADFSSAMIRKQCLTLLAALVAQDYIKCKGLVVFRYGNGIGLQIWSASWFYLGRLLTCLSDPHQSIRELAEAVAINIVLPRQVRQHVSQTRKRHHVVVPIFSHFVHMSNRVSSCPVFQANFIQNHFLEMLCFMNGWAGHPIFRPSAVGGAAYLSKSSAFCLLTLPQRRQLIYQFLFQHMNERDKHEISR